MFKDYPRHLITMCSNCSGEVQAITALEDKGNSIPGTAISSHRFLNIVVTKWDLS